MGDIVRLEEKQRSTPGAPGVESPDNEIAALGRRDPKRGLALLVAKYRRPLFRHAYHMLRNAEEAYETVQEVFLRAYREKRLFNDGFHIKGWLYRVTANLCLKQIRSRRVRSVFASRKQAEPPPPNDLLPVTQAIEGETREEIMAAIDKLPPRFRSLIVLRYYDGFSYKEIADTLSMPIGSVMSGLSRARDKLRKMLADKLQLEDFSS